MAINLTDSVRIAVTSAAVPCSAGTGVFRLLHSEFNMRKPLAMAASQSASQPAVRSVPSGPWPTF
jgi:hypothetical protein